MNTNTPKIGGKRLLSRDDLVALGILFSRAHLHRLVRDGKFPAPVALGPQRDRARKAGALKTLKTGWPGCRTPATRARLEG